MKDILVVQNIKKSFGGLVALRGVSMKIEEGLLSILIGPNGSGKTTLINIITGFYKPDEGTVKFYGKDITGWSPHRICQEGLMRTFQIPLPFLKLTVLENLLTARRGNPGESFLKAPLKRSWMREEEEAVEEAFRILELIDMDHLWDQPSSKLSGGQLKLLEIGRALINGARMILMDEPLAGVNPVLAHDIFSHLIDLKKMGLTFMIVEHRLELALPYVDYAYAMFGGQIISEGTPDEVVNDPRVIESYLGL